MRSNIFARRDGGEEGNLNFPFVQIYETDEHPGMIAFAPSVAPPGLRMLRFPEPVVATTG
jgi:hypothetical protein